MLLDCGRTQHLVKKAKNMLNQKTLLKLGSLLFAVIYFTVTFLEEETLNVNDQLRYRQLGVTELSVNSIRKLRILTLGGSVTWGAGIGIKNREDAYPFRLQNEHGHLVTNLAIRGTSSEYPSQCITSMSNSYDPNDPLMSSYLSSQSMACEV